MYNSVDFWILVFWCFNQYHEILKHSYHPIISPYSSTALPLSSNHCKQPNYFLIFTHLSTHLYFLSTESCNAQPLCLASVAYLSVFKADLCGSTYQYSNGCMAEQCVCMCQRGSTLLIWFFRGHLGCLSFQLLWIWWCEHLCVSFSFLHGGCSLVYTQDSGIATPSIMLLNFLQNCQNRFPPQLKGFLLPRDAWESHFPKFLLTLTIACHFPSLSVPGWYFLGIWCNWAVGPIPERYPNHWKSVISGYVCEGVSGRGWLGQGHHPIS